MTTIYQLKHSPYCIPFVAIFRSLGLQLEEVNVSAADRREIIELTDGAYYQVPVLVHDGKIIFESGSDTQDVARYVDQHFAGGRLFPKEREGIQMLLIANLENEVEGVTFKLCDIHYVPSIDDVVERTMLIRHKERRFGRGCVDQWRHEAGAIREQVEKLLLPYHLMLEANPFLTGDKPVYADFLLYGILGNYTFEGYNSILVTLPNLEPWRKRIEEYRFK